MLQPLPLPQPLASHLIHPIGPSLTSRGTSHAWPPRNQYSPKNRMARSLAFTSRNGICLRNIHRGLSLSNLLGLFTAAAKSSSLLTVKKNSTCSELIRAFPHVSSSFAFATSIIHVQHHSRNAMFPSRQKGPMLLQVRKAFCSVSSEMSPFPHVRSVANLRAQLTTGVTFSQLREDIVVISTI